MIATYNKQLKKAGEYNHKKGLTKNFKKKKINLTNLRIKYVLFFLQIWIFFRLQNKKNR